MKNVWEAGRKQRISASPSRIDVSFNETPALLMSFPFSGAYANVIKYNFSLIVFEKFFLHCGIVDVLCISNETMATELKLREKVYG